MDRIKYMIAYVLVFYTPYCWRNPRVTNSSFRNHRYERPIISWAWKTLVGFGKD